MKQPREHIFESPEVPRSRQPRILDVLRAVKAIAPRHASVAAWWYAPPRRLRLRGELPAGDRSPLEVVVEERGPRPTDTGAVAADLSRELGVLVSVRTHRGPLEDRGLFRLLSGEERTAAGSGAARWIS